MRRKMLILALFVAVFYVALTLMIWAITAPQRRYVSATDYQLTLDVSRNQNRSATATAQAAAQE